MAKDSKMNIIGSEERKIMENDRRPYSFEASIR